jgi:peptidoglycan/LPS O-acetylase OafA/YrhL
MPLEKHASGRLDVLDGWRTVSVAMVIIDHLWNFSGLQFQFGSEVLDDEVGKFSYYFGTLGVTTFFIISGFVICRGFISENETNGRISIPAFYIRRTLRIVPPLLLYVAVVLGLVWTGVIENTALTTAMALTFTCNIQGVPCGGWFGGHTWSLATEEQFYLVFPLLFIAAASWRRQGVFYLIGALFTGYLAAYAVDNPALSDFLRNQFCICLGATFALHRETVQRWAAHLPSLAVPLALVGSLLAMRLMASPFEYAGLILWPLLIAAALMASISRPSIAANVLSHPVMVLVGRASYGIYLWQQVATIYYPNAGWPFYLMSVTVCIAGSIALFHYMERPLIALGSRISKRLTRTSDKVRVSPPNCSGDGPTRIAPGA